MDPLPTEIHVFLSIWTQRPLVVVAGDPQRLFQVTAEGIAEVPRDSGALNFAISIKRFVEKRLARIAFVFKGLCWGHLWDGAGG